MAPFIDNELLSSHADASNGSTPELTSHSDSDSTDMFLYYSCNETRIKTLKMNDDPEAIKKEGIANMVSTEQRKTRISFELHPDVIMEDLLELSEGLEEDFTDLIMGNDDSFGEMLAEMALLDEMLNACEPKPNPSGR